MKTFPEEKVFAVVIKPEYNRTQKYNALLGFVLTDDPEKAINTYVDLGYARETLSWLDADAAAFSIN